jgi:hypothetical protein
MRLIPVIQRAALAAAAVACVSCGDVVRDGRSASFLIIDEMSSDKGNYVQSDVITDGSVFNDLVEVALRLAPKNVIPGDLAPGTNNAVTVNRYRVTYRRTDGRNTPGVDVPYGFDGAATVTIPANGTASLSIEVVRHVAKIDSPLVQLVANPTIISTIAEITFYGRDQVGNDISAIGLIQVNFGNFADED